MQGMGLIEGLVTTSPLYFTANGRNRKCYIRLMPDNFEHPQWGYQTNRYTVVHWLYCLYTENLDLREKDVIIYKAKEQRIMTRMVKGNKRILVLKVEQLKPPPKKGTT